MMKSRLTIVIGCLLLCLPAAAQTNKLIKELESKRGALQEEIQKSESLLKTTKKNVGSQLNGIAALNGQIEKRKQYIETINNDMGQIDSELGNVEGQLSALEKELNTRKRRYESSVLYLYKNRSIQEKLMFILSADNFYQTMRRMRYMREYSTYQYIQAKEIQQKQEQVNSKKQELRQVRTAKENLLKTREQEKQKLEKQQQEKQAMVKDLQKKQKALQQEITKKRRQANNLNAQIDKLIAIEIEKSRKQAQAEAKKEGGGSSNRRQADEGKGTQKSKPIEAYTMSRADRELSGNFVNNKGRLPMPISGPYIIVSHFGQYDVSGLRNVKLDNKGIDIQGKPGAQARAIFNGKVAAVFQLNGLFNILVRHGAYISVYCNLSSTSVKTGDNVTTKQTLGRIFASETTGGNPVLHFQLRKERDKLNPEPWLNR